MEKKVYSRQLLGKTVVSKSGKKLGEVTNIQFDVATGELVCIVLGTPTTYALSLDIQKNEEGKLMFPFSSVTAISDFVVINEEEVV